MREIKFRAWDKKQLRMLSVYSLSKPLVTVIDYKTTGKEAIEANPMVNLNEVEPYRDIPSNEVELMQFTGLKDKNGKEIYEGDVVEYKNPVFTSDIRKDRVEWDEWYAGFDPFCNHGVDISYKIDGLDVGIIGNIYENPALLHTPSQN